MARSGKERNMCSVKQRITFAGSIVLLAVLVGWACVPSLADDKKAKDAKTDEAKIVLPKDPKAIVLSYDPGAGGFIRKGEAPHLKIQADGQVFVVNPHDGVKKEAKLPAMKLEELLRFVVKDNDFFNLTEAKINDAIKAAAGKGPFIAVGGAGTSVIAIHVNGKKHEVKFRGASAYLQAYPKTKVLEQFVAIEKRLSTYALSVSKGK
jgi:hypothetical protein